ncbi:MAG: ATP-binding cassette domain-containing protein, partial [Myxococcales bacterium]|nr:ATP-binding cassette domain-containing protein [Myxococcales bacterium]
IGLHPRDTRRLVDILRALVERGNTVVVVEHDRDLIEAGDYLVEMGPGSGEHGGEVVFAGPRDEYLATADTVTTAYLRGERLIHVPERRRPGRLGDLQIVGASGNNLKHIDVTIPLGNFVCVTGVSGSGKSTLIHDTLYRALARLFDGGSDPIARFERLGGVDKLSGVKVVDQSPIGKTPRSNPITYIGAFSEIRSLFVETGRARAQRMTSGMFSFNVVGGRCENCQGAGFVKVEMHFVADVYIRCPVCEGRRYMKKVLDVRYKGMNIHEVLETTVDAGATFFADRSKIAGKLNLMRDVGLGYLRLGQPANTLSGGEAQRLKIAAELAQPSRGHTLYILDEPTTGLHFDEVRLLIKVLNRLVDAGNSVVVIEHNMELVKTADHVIDLGPEGGEGGGEVVASGTPEEVAAHPTSHTGRVLRETFRRYDAALD